MSSTETGIVPVAAERRRSPRIPPLAACGLAGFLVAALFSFAVYPRIAGPAGAGLDPDGHGALGWGLWKLGTLSFYPNWEPTVSRGPLYPMAVAAILRLSPNAWPFNVQFVQAVWFAITCMLAFLIGRRLFGERAGWIAGILTSVYPLLVWYTARVWIETMTITLFTGFVLACLHFLERPSARGGAMVGLLVGALCLSKATFLPFLAVVPVYAAAFVPRARAIVPLAAIPMAALLVILPWTVRNWMLTGTFILVHGQGGFNLRMGDYWTAHASESGYNFGPHWQRLTGEAAEIFNRAKADGDPGWKAEIKVNEGLLKASLADYAARPLILARKAMVNAIGFWALSETRTKSIVSGLMNLPLLALFPVALARIWRRRGLTAGLGFPLAAIGVYYLVHLPFLGAVRYCSVILPVMLVYAAGGLFPPGEKGKGVPA